MGQGSKNGLKDKAYQCHVRIGGQMKRSIWHIGRIGQAIRTDKNAQHNRELEEERADQEMVRSGVSCVSRCQPGSEHIHSIDRSSGKENDSCGYLNPDRLIQNFFDQYTASERQENENCPGESRTVQWCIQHRWQEVVHRADDSESDKSQNVEMNVGQACMAVRVMHKPEGHRFADSQSGKQGQECDRIEAEI